MEFYSIGTGDWGLGLGTSVLEHRPSGRPAPTPRSPLNATVRQNDPASGCTYDPVHGYGVMLDFVWDPPIAGPPISRYAISLIDGTGRE